MLRNTSSRHGESGTSPVLNEVLSLNAQELVVGRLGLTVWPSSMKS